MGCNCGCSQPPIGGAFGLAGESSGACGCGCSRVRARPRLVRLVRLERMPLAPLGELRGLIYRPRPAFNGDAPKNYIHFFQRPPLLAADPAGRRLYILGGHYRLTPRGIEG
jgi:hypothetical protein